MEKAIVIFSVIGVAIAYTLITIIRHSRYMQYFQNMMEERDIILKDYESLCEELGEIPILNPTIKQMQDHLNKIKRCRNTKHKQKPQQSE